MRAILKCETETKDRMITYTNYELQRVIIFE